MPPLEQVDTPLLELSVFRSVLFGMDEQYPVIAMNSQALFILLFGNYAIKIRVKCLSSTCALRHN